MALRASKLIVVGAEAATMVCFLAIPAATISDWIRPTPAAGTFLAQWPMYFVSGRSQISSSNTEFGGSGRCRITAGSFGELQPNGRTSSRRRFAIDPLPPVM